jgi:hypothetical protein
MPRDYYISFDTKEVPGMIKAVKVSLDTEIVSDMGKKFPINLVDDPLYLALCRYIRNNPPYEDQ